MLARIAAGIVASLLAATVSTAAHVPSSLGILIESAVGSLATIVAALIMRPGRPERRRRRDVEKERLRREVKRLEQENADLRKRGGSD